MRTTITKLQKTCMFIGAVLFGSLFTSGVAFEILKEEPELALRNPEVIHRIREGAFLFCFHAWLLVLGAWFGALVSGVWRSPAGKRVFLTLGGGIISAFVSVVAAVFVWDAVTGGQAPVPGYIFAETIVFGGAYLVGTLLGLLVGHLTGRRLQQRLEMWRTIPEPQDAR